MGDGTVVVTTAGETAREVVEAHEARVAESAAAHGAPKPVEFKLRSFAETLEEVLRQS